jgi:hypothetical protein
MTDASAEMPLALLVPFPPASGASATRPLAAVQRNASFVLLARFPLSPTTVAPFPDTPYATPYG